MAKPTVLSPATTPPVAPSVAPGESAPVRRELRWKFEDEDQNRWNHEKQICVSKYLKHVETAGRLRVIP